MDRNINAEIDDISETKLIVASKELLLLLHTFNSFFSGTTWVSWHQKSKTSLDLNEARYDWVLGCSGISWTICKQSAPRSRQITTPIPRHSIFLMPNQQCQSTEGKVSDEQMIIKTVVSSKQKYATSTFKTKMQEHSNCQWHVTKINKKSTEIHSTSNTKHHNLD